jgi:hypothetical protein
MSEKLDKGLSWLTLVAKLLSVLESLLPAFLVAWNNALRQKNRDLQQDVDLLKIKMKEESNCHAKDSQPVSRRKFIDSYLSRK